MPQEKFFFSVLWFWKADRKKNERFPEKTGLWAKLSKILKVSKAKQESVNSL